MQTTTNYALKKPELADSPPDITVTNPNWDTLDSMLKTWENGATETGKGLVELATVAEVQTGTDTSRAVTPAGVTGLAGATTPAMDGTGAVGTSKYYARQDHVHPKDTSKMDNTAAGLGALVNGATAKTTPVDADSVGLVDSAASNVIKKLTWANIKATLKTYFDTLYNNYVHPTTDGNLHVPATGTTNDGKVLKSGATAGSASWVTLDMSFLPDSVFKKSVKAATTSNITLSGTQTVDGISVVAGDRVLVKNQTTASQNGIYVVAAGAWTRATDADIASEVAGAVVCADQGTVNGGQLFTTYFKTTDTLGTTSMAWYGIIDTSKAGTATPSTVGTAAVGTSEKYAREDHVHAGPSASETVKGLVELATPAETTTGTDTTRAVHPAGLKVELDKKLGVTAKAADSELLDGLSAESYYKQNGSFGGTTDFNTLIIPGVYQATEISNCLNKPQTVSTYGVTFVDAAGVYIHQTFKSTLNEIVVRNSSDGGSTYTPWDNQQSVFRGSVTIPSTGWAAAVSVSPYNWYVDINITGALATDKIDLDVQFTGVTLAETARLGPIEEHDGFIRLLAVNVPTGTIAAKYTIFR